MEEPVIRLRPVIERHLVYPLARLLATEQVSLGDVISIDWEVSEPGLIFCKEVERWLVWGAFRWARTCLPTRHDGAAIK